jgi:hypothetical protein
MNGVWCTKGVIHPMIKLNCQQTEEALQKLLDARAGQPLPRTVTEHLAHCAQCQSWQTLLHLPLPSPGVHVPAGFAGRVVERHQWERRKQRWFRYGSMLALAACLLVGVFTLFNLPANHQAQATLPISNVREQQTTQLFTSIRYGYVALLDQALSIQPPSIPLPELPSWELPGIDDPFSIGRPALQTISNTFQNTIEPLEAPTKAAIQRVKSVIDDPEVRKFMSRLNGRAT